MVPGEGEGGESIGPRGVLEDEKALVGWIAEDFYGRRSSTAEQIHDGSSSSSISSGAGPVCSFLSFSASFLLGGSGFVFWYLILFVPSIIFVHWLTALSSLQASLTTTLGGELAGLLDGGGSRGPPVPTKRGSGATAQRSGPAEHRAP